MADTTDVVDGAAATLAAPGSSRGDDEAPRDDGPGRPPLGGLLATKLRIPTAPAGFVRRPRLTGLLDDGADMALTLVGAPAGFGKTTLLADWSRRQERPVAWVSLDAADNDPARFWRHAAGALDQVSPGVAGAAAPLLEASPAGSPAPFEGVAAAIVNALVAGGSEALWVIDDYHVIEAEPVHASLRFLLDHPPPGLRLVLAGRSDPPLPLARWRARGRLREVRSSDLRFTAEEAAAMLAATTPVELAGDAVGALVARTEGWAAGLQLAGLSLRDRADAAAFVDSFSGSHRYVLDYLSEEVLDHLDGPTREFLLDTSVLDRLSGPLCDAVTGRSDSQRMLEAVEAADLFLEPLDDVRGWWRYHQLFADLLRNRLHQLRPERERELHRNAAAWHQDHGEPDDAVHHALASGDASWATELVERYADGLQLRGGIATLERWIAALPTDLVSSRPRLLLARTRDASIDEGERLLAAAEHAMASTEPGTTGLAATGEPSGRPTAETTAGIPALVAIGRSFNAMWRGDAERTAELARRAAQLAPADPDGPDSVLATTIAGHTGAVAWLEGRLDDAERMVLEVIPRFRALGAIDPAAVAVLILGQIRRAQGRLNAAADAYQGALDEAERDRQALPATGLAHLGLAEVAYQRDELDLALDHVTAGLPLCRRFAFARWLPNGLATLAWIHHTRGDTAAAQAAIAEAGRLADPAATDLLNAVPAERARLLLAQGDLDAAARWADEQQLGPDGEPSYPRERAHLTRARILTARGHVDEALALLDRLHRPAAAGSRIGSVIEILALRASALSAAGDRSGATSTLADALALGAPEGYVRVFADEGPALGALLGDLIASRRDAPTPSAAEIPAPYLKRLIHAFEHPGDPHAGATTSTALVTQLTDREMEVLRLMATGQRNQEIAAELYVALNTVKKHVTHIFEKLGVTNRTEATARARELGLLDT